MLLGDTVHVNVCVSVCAYAKDGKSKNKSGIAFCSRVFSELLLNTIITEMITFSLMSHLQT